MLLAQKEERSRQFALALRAGLPILFLISLLLYATQYDTQSITIDLKTASIVAAITFVTVYFIYFLIALSVEESLIDMSSQRFNKRAFIEQLKHKKNSTLILIKINNLQLLYENYSPSQIDNLFYTLTKKIDLAFVQNSLPKPAIGKYYDSDFIIALENTSDTLNRIIEKILINNKIVDNMEIDYHFSILTNTTNDFDKSISQLQDLIHTQTTKHTVTPQLQTEDSETLNILEENIISAIQTKELHLSFRPLWNTSSKIVDIYEITVKLPASNEEILPRVFLPIINRLGLGREYDFILLQHTVAFLALIDKSVSFTFNLSPFSLRDHDFQEKVFRLIAEKNIDASRLIIQIYERKTHHDLSGYLETLKRFKRQHMRICIDNFGSSSSSMEYMKHFKFDMVKFDRDYVTKLQDTTTRSMFHSFIHMAKELNIITIAKWVDTEDQKETLFKLGIDYLQGHGISKYITEQQLIAQYNQKDTHEIRRKRDTRI